MTLQNPKPSDGEPIHCVYWCHLPDHTDAMTQGYIGIATNHRRRERDHRKHGRFPDGFIFTVLARNLTRFEAAKIEWEHRKQRHIGWNHKKGGGKFIRSLMEQRMPTPTSNPRIFKTGASPDQ